MHLREQHANFRMGAGQRLQRQGSMKNAAMSAGSRKGRRRWMEGSQDDSQADADAGVGSDLIPASRGEGNTGHIVRMKRAEAWSKFLAYEGCCQVSSSRHLLNLIVMCPIMATPADASHCMSATSISQQPAATLVLLLHSYGCCRCA